MTNEEKPRTLLQLPPAKHVRCLTAVGKNGRVRKARKVPVIVMKISNNRSVVTGQRAPRVTQMDLEETFAWKHEVKNKLREGDILGAEAAILQHSQVLLRIESALRHGAKVEPGCHDAKLEPDSHYSRLELTIL